VSYLHKCCQDSNAAQEAVFDMSKAGLQSGLVSGSYVVTLRPHQGSQIVSFLLSKAVLAQCDPRKGAARVLTRIQSLVSSYNSLLFW